jgi:release factor glutamine methyltransferase
MPSSPTSATASSATAEVSRKDEVAGPTATRRQVGGLGVDIATTVGSDREASWIIEHVTRTLGLEGQPADKAARALAGRRAAGEPLQYVLGRWPFRTVELDVDPRVLIPRPETEQVVEVALERLASSLRRAERVEGPTVCCDLGTGSGAIALSLAAEAPLGVGGLEVWATDRSTDALAVARANADRLDRAALLRSARLELAEGSWFEALPPALLGRLDLVVSNPPYVAAGEFTDLDPTVRCYEPISALVAGPGSRGTPGMAEVEVILLAARRWLRPTGLVVVEIAPHQAEPAAAVARSAGLAHVTVEPDLAGRPRMVVAGC